MKWNWAGRAACLLMWLCVSAGRAGGGEAPDTWPRPSRQPLLVASATRPDIVTRILETRQARALRLDARDFSGRIPGLGANLSSLRDFVAALSERRAEDFWFCLSGSSILAPSTSLGCDWEGDGDIRELGAWLETLFPDQALATRLEQRSTKKQRWAAAASSRALAEAVEGGEGTEVWRSDLETFLADKSDTLGVWLNPRPILGAASLLSGINLRREVSRHGLALPGAMHIRLAAGLDLGMTLRLVGVFPEPWEWADESDFVIERTDQSLLRLNIPAPLVLLERLLPETPPLFLANIDLRALAPQAACLDFWRGPEGGYDWSLVCHIGDTERFRKQLARVHAWLNILAASPATSLILTDIEVKDGVTMKRVDRGRFTCFFGTMENDEGDSYFVLANAPRVLPDASEVATSLADEPVLASWRIDLDEPARELVAEGVLRLLGGKNLPGIDTDAVRALVRYGDSGTLTVDDASLVLTARQGSSPFVFAGLIAAFDDLENDIE